MFAFSPTDFKQNEKPIHIYLDILKRGDLSSLSWLESPFKNEFRDERDDLGVCKTEFCSINFKDVMIATGRLPGDTLPGE